MNLSLRRRVLLGCSLVAVVLLVADVILASTFRSFLLGRVDDQLVAATEPVSLGDRSFPRGDPNPQPHARPGRGGRRDYRLPGTGQRVDPSFFTEFFVAQYDADGTLVARPGPGLREDEQPPPRVTAANLAVRTGGEPFTVPATEGTGTWRVMAVAHTGGGATVIGVSLSDMSATLRRVWLIQGIATATVLAALGAVAVWVLRLGVRPLAAMAGTAEAIAAGDLSRRVESAGGPTEAGQLGSALNMMLERIEGAFRAKEASEERLRRFVADASHELRTPLTSIRGYADLYRAGGLADPATLSEAMRRMEAEGRRMSGLVEDLLLLARLDAGAAAPGGPEGHANPVRLDRLVADAVADARAVEPDRPIDVALDPVTVNGDEPRLRQVAANLLANARVHTPAGTPVSVSVSAAGGTARLVVADQGPGMTPDEAGHVFERFYRGDPSRRRVPPGGSGGVAAGSGLGLSIVAAVAEAHGGRAGVETAPGAGARFMVELPARTALGSP